MHKATDLVLINTPLKDYDISKRINKFTLPTLGLAYIATVAESAGFSVQVIDAEARGIGFDAIARDVNAIAPRWVGLNLLAPTYENSKAILKRINPEIRVMLGGHQAKAMPNEILADLEISRIDALIIGEAELRVVELLKQIDSRDWLPLVYWRDEFGEIRNSIPKDVDRTWLSPDINRLPLVDRRFLDDDPYLDGGVLESAMVASRGCPFDCSFCGAAVSANPDISIRMREAESILNEIKSLKSKFGVLRIRFVDDLFLSSAKNMFNILSAFVREKIQVEWDATGRINILNSASDEIIELMKKSGCREIALGIETGSDRLLAHIDKKISVSQVKNVVMRLCSQGINVKGYFIFGLPTETVEEHLATISLIRELWRISADLPGSFRCSVFEYRPYPGTPDWSRLLEAGFKPAEMLKYDSGKQSDLVDGELTPDRDEFNFSTGLQFGEVPVSQIRKNLKMIMIEQARI